MINIQFEWSLWIFICVVTVSSNLDFVMWNKSVNGEDYQQYLIRNSVVQLSKINFKVALRTLKFSWNQSVKENYQYHMKFHSSRISLLSIDPSSISTLGEVPKYSSNFTVDVNCSVVNGNRLRDIQLNNLSSHLHSFHMEIVFTNPTQRNQIFTVDLHGNFSCLDIVSSELAYREFENNSSNEFGVIICSGVLVMMIVVLSILLLLKLIHSRQHSNHNRILLRRKRNESKAKIYDVTSISLIEANNEQILKDCNNNNIASSITDKEQPSTTLYQNDQKLQQEVVKQFLHSQTIHHKHKKKLTKKRQIHSRHSQQHKDVTQVSSRLLDQLDAYRQLISQSVDNAHSANQDEDKDSFVTTSSKDTHQTGATPIINRKIRDPLHIINEIQIPRTSITLKRLIIEGTFSQIYEAIMISKSYSSSRSKQACQKVLIKTLADCSTLNQSTVMLRDGTLLAGLRHRNLCSVIGAAGAIYDDRNQQSIVQPPWLIYPLPYPGNLKLLLHNRQPHQYSHITDIDPNSTNSSRSNLQITFSSPSITLFALQILRALKYLHTRGIIHKDVATRNCFLKSSDHIQLCDSALSRDLFPEDYHCLGDNENRPVKWLSVEALVQRRFSTASDVWAFGIFAWELVTGGALPYFEIDPFEMPTFLRNGFRLKQPDNCPDKLWWIIYSCWNCDINSRPKIVEVIRNFKSFQKILLDFV